MLKWESPNIHDASVVVNLTSFSYYKKEIREIKEIGDFLYFSYFLRQIG
jgi:hypothetical protein